MAAHALAAARHLPRPCANRHARGQIHAERLSLGASTRTDRRSYRFETSRTSRCLYRRPITRVYSTAICSSAHSNRANSGTGLSRSLRCPIETESIPAGHLLRPARSDRGGSRHAQDLRNTGLNIRCDRSAPLSDQGISRACPGGAVVASIHARSARLEPPEGSHTPCPEHSTPDD